MWTDLECSAQLSICSMKALKKCICSKLPIFDLPFMFVLQIHPHPPPSPPPIPLYHMLTLVSVTPALRKSSGTFMNFQMKNQRVKREKIINFFCKPNIKD